MTIPSLFDQSGISDAELIEGMRRGERLAFAQFQLRFMPLLLVEARRAQIPDDERQPLVMDLLDDMIMRWLEPSMQLPRSLAAYLVTAFRRRALNMHRTAARHLRVVREVAVDAEYGTATGSGSDACALSSESTRRASAGPHVETVAIAPAVARLAALLTRGLSMEEMRMLEWAANHVPQREMAAWLGISYEAAGKRIRRLRARLIIAARKHIDEMDTRDQRFLQHLVGQAVVGASRDSRDPSTSSNVRRRKDDHRRDHP